MATLLYSPGVKIYVDTTEGMLDLTDDLVSGRVSLQENMPHRLTFTIANHRRKYDRVFTPNDRVVVRMKRINWVLVFSGFLNTVPYLTVLPRSITLSATCTLKKLQYRLWDPGAIDSYNLLHSVGDASDGIADVDGGLQKKMRVLITEVGGWNGEQIHIGELPRRWLTKVSDLYDKVSNRIEAEGRNLGSTPVVGGANLLQQGTATLPSNIPGTGRLPNTSGRISWFGGQGGGAYNSFALTGEPGGNPGPATGVWRGRNPGDEFFCAMRWPYVTENRRPIAGINSSDAQRWWANKKILVVNPRNNRAVVVRAADWGPNIKTGRVIDVSKYAFDALGAKTDDNVEIAFADQNAPLGLVAESSKTTAAPVPIAGPPNPYDVTDPAGRTSAQYVFPVDGGTYNNQDYPKGDWHAPRVGHRHQGTDIFAKRGALLRAITSGTVHWRDGGTAGVWVILNGDDGNTYYYMHLETGSRPAGQNGQHVTAGTVIGKCDNTGNAAHTASHCHFEVHPKGGSAVPPRTVLDAIKAGTTVPGTDAAAGGGIGTDSANLVNAYDWVGAPDPESEILYGPRALMNDTALLPYIGALCNASLRNYCSAPNGDFIAWFPDYFGSYGTAGIMDIQDIELMDFSIVWDDEHLITHQFVVAAATGYSAAPLPGGAIEAYQKYMTVGIASVEFPEIMDALFNISGKSDASGWANPEAIFRRFGARAAVATIETISGSKAEFWYAVHLFQQNWASQFTAQVPMTFMPELFPGMLIRVPSRGFQAYVNAVEHSFDFQGGGFTTQATICAPSATDGSGLYGLARTGAGG